MLGDAPAKVDFPALVWKRVEGGGASGRAKGRTLATGETIRLLEITPKWNESEWCRKAHIGFVLSGRLRLDFVDFNPLDIGKGQAFSIPAGCAHKASCKRPTRMFIVG
jgi:quercetin dioxygenase-like cupin family protein